MLEKAPYPLGSTINGSPHSVCVSLPTMRDVVGYEEKDPSVLQTVKTGYPRFIHHPFIREVEMRFLDGKNHETTQYRGPVLATRKAAEDLERFLSGKDCKIEEENGLFRLLAPNEKNIQRQCRLFVQHTGTEISSRQAEDWLSGKGFIESRFSEPSFSGDADAYIREALHGVYGTHSREDITLYRGGMNAFYAAFKALNKIQGARGRHLWIQLGWLYVDTAEILKKFAPSENPLRILNIFDWHTLEEVFKTNGSKIAGVVTEVPTNPLVQTCDLERLVDMCRDRGAALVLDPSVASPKNVNILPFSDVHINSLTKYAGNQGDVMLGALALNRTSAFFDEMAGAINQPDDPPYIRDMERLAYEIDAYGDVVEKINENTCFLASFLGKKKQVNRVFWSYQESSRENYEKIATGDHSPGAIISITLKKPVAEFYDRLELAKSPSFGTGFSMACPFMYLAHYDLVKTASGREYLKRAGIDPDLIRISVGTEPIDQLLKIFDEAL